MSIIGHGSKFELGSGSGSPETFTEIDGVLSIELGSSKVDTVDSSTMKDTSRARSYIAGREDAGEYTVKGNFLPGNTSQVALRTAKDSAAHNFKAIYPGAVATESFSGIVTSFDITNPDDKNVEFTCKVKVSGEITIS